METNQSPPNCKILAHFVPCNDSISPLCVCSTINMYARFKKNEVQNSNMCSKMDDYFYGYRRRVVRHILKTYKSVQETQLQSFQYKIIHRIIACNKKLFDMKIKDSPTCNFCNKIDDIDHFFFYCPIVQTVWRLFFNWWNNLTVWLTSC